MSTVGVVNKNPQIMETGDYFSDPDPDPEI